MKLLKVILLLFSMSCFGQKAYFFDHMIEYDFYRDFSSSKSIKYYYLTNSLDNAYSAVLTEKDSLTYKVDFLDHSGIHSISEISKSRFSEIDSFPIVCQYVKPHANVYKRLAKHYEFKILDDTLVKGHKQRHYVLKPLKTKKNRTSEHYIVDTSLDTHLPILRYSTAYDKWKGNKILPNGIMVEKFLMSDNGKKRHCLLFRRLSYIDKTLTIPEDCDYTK